ncbi:MAG: hypothetical protein ACYDDH_10625 [Candidatus Desulforudaceae bacterium]
MDATPFRLARRLWQTSTFDLATLATRHRLHLPYQAMDVMLGQCNVELAIQADSLDDAIGWLHSILLGLYIEGVSPTIAPFATSHGINEYSGINSRDSALLREEMPEAMRSGVTSDHATVEAWPVQMSFSCQVLRDRLEITPAKFMVAAASAQRWRSIESTCPTLKVVRDAAQAAPLLGSMDQSLLHLWCALEALFPKVSTEVSFRLALYIAQLKRSPSPWDVFRRTRDAYNLRSRVAHGLRSDVTIDEWREAWELLIGSASAILHRGSLPTEDELLDELLTKDTRDEEKAV